MDPNETLKKLREIAADGDPQEFEEMIELFHSLDEWICREGFLPNDWVGQSSKPHPFS